MITPAKVVPLTFLGLGLFLLLQVIWPVISFQLWYLGQKQSDIALVSPNLSDQQVLGISIQTSDNFPRFVSDLKRESQASYKSFSISIPRLKIDKADVLVDSNDLSEGLAHLPGSALPGEKGNMFISGHSALSPLFSLKKAIFASLQNLKEGDEITIEAADTKFRYVVMQLKVVDPKDISVISPPDSVGRYISLMTCVPPGLNFKRLVVLGKMI